MMLTVPADFHMWRFWASSLDTCQSDYVYSGSDIYFYEMSTPSTVDFTSGSSTITLTNGFDGYDGYFVNQALGANDFRQNATYDLEEVISDGVPDFSAPNSVPTPLAPTFTNPQPAPPCRPWPRTRSPSPGPAVTAPTGWCSSSTTTTPTSPC